MLEKLNELLIGIYFQKKIKPCNWGNLLHNMRLNLVFRLRCVFFTFFFHSCFGLLNLLLERNLPPKVYVSKSSGRIEAKESDLTRKYKTMSAKQSIFKEYNLLSRNGK